MEPPHVARGPLTAVRHQDETFRPNVRSGFLLLHDSSQSHVAEVHQQFLDVKGRVLLTGLTSPDMKPINQLSNQSIIRVYADRVYSLFLTDYNMFL